MWLLANTATSNTLLDTNPRSKISSVLDPKLFIPDPDQASNFPSSGSRSGSNLY